MAFERFIICDFATPLAFNAPTEGFPGTISVKFCTEVHNNEEILPKVSSPE